MAKKKATKKEEPTPEPAEQLNAFGLTPQQELFCTYYTRPGEFFANATLAYAEAYDFKLDTLSQVDEYIDGPAENDDDLLDDDGGEGVKRERRLSDRINIKSPYQRQYNVAAVMASRLLNNDKVQACCRKKLLDLMSDDVVDSERMKIILQTDDLPSKLKALVSYDKLRGRIIDKTQQVGSLAFGEADLAAVIATLSQERQDHWYGVIKELIEEAELRRSDSQVESGGDR